MPLARLDKVGEEDEDVKEKLCLFLSFSSRCSGGLACGPEVVGELELEAEDSCGKVAVLGVVAGEECEEDGQTKPTRLLLRSRHVGRRRSTEGAGAGSAAGFDAGVEEEEDRCMAGY